MHNVSRYKAAAQYLSDQGVCPKEERCHEIRTELIRRKLNPYGTYEQISRKLKADQGVQSRRLKRFILMTHLLLMKQVQ